jgi:hypothetical protein
MTLKEYLLEQPYERIALLWFEGGQIRCEEYGLNDYDKINKELLQMEFMESNDEEDCKEIWIR